MEFEFDHLEVLCRMARLKDKEFTYQAFVPHLVAAAVDLAHEGYLDVREGDHSAYDGEEDVPFYRISEKGLELAERLGAVASRRGRPLDFQVIEMLALASDGGEHDLSYLMPMGLGGAAAELERKGLLEKEGGVYKGTPACRAAYECIMSFASTVLGGYGNPGNQE